MTLTYTLLLISILLGFLNPNRTVVLIGLGIALSAGLYEGILDVLGASIMILFAGLTHLYFNKKLNKPHYRIPLFLSVLGLMGALTLHLLPGFHNARVIDGLRLSDQSTPFTMYLNFDKTSVALIFFALSPLFILEKPMSIRTLGTTLLILCACVLTVFIPSYAFGYVAFDPKLPSVLGLWAVNNLFFVCVAEEIMFRGLIQRTLSSFLKSPYLSILLSSLLFGLAHFKGGMGLVGLGTLAGLFYGYAYHRTQSLLPAVLVHFGLNLVHFIFFSYPTLLKVH